MTDPNPAGRRRMPATVPSTWRGRLLVLVAAAAAGLAPLARAADCPPPPAVPTADQVRDGQRAARDHGVLWRVERPAAVGQPAAEGWLYGTLHVGRLAWAFPGPQLQQALRGADALALELDPDDPATAAGVARGMALLREAEQLDPLPTEVLARLAGLARAECAEPMLAGQPALMQALTLSLLNGRREGLEPAFAQEQVLAAVARAGGKPVLSLETADGQIAQLLPDRPGEMTAMVEHTLAQIQSGQSRRLLLQLSRAWDSGDLDTLGSAERWCECTPDSDDARLLRRLNDERNPALADAIVARLDRGQKLVAAVGALHMTGPQGLPALLAQRGFTVTRVVFAAR